MGHERKTKSETKKWAARRNVTSLSRPPNRRLPRRLGVPTPTRLHIWAGPSARDAIARQPGSSFALGQPLTGQSLTSEKKEKMKSGKPKTVCKKSGKVFNSNTDLKIKFKKSMNTKNYMILKKKS